ncbi:hypothetical protein JT27_18355 [Alcaligenes faecalis]|uniref:hypothetical protein n=1 Tax=Alcaligenes faecalis TaxID=511 RepID=UPI00052D2FAB|nr:hypothetical protein [Alcaligenes faecalis]KGP00293.1 hypothetical protein JT27_18355 [Alcaligenes faecalis]
MLLAITIHPDGTTQAMQRDELDLGFLGPRRVQRATEIMFNDQTQKWDIEPTNAICHGGEPGLESEHLRGFDKYEQARKIEVTWLNTCRSVGVPPCSCAGIDILKGVRQAPGF